MNTQQPRLIALILLSTLLALPADARVGIEASPMEFLSLEIGNQWTYEHFYQNRFHFYEDFLYGYDYPWAAPGSSVQQAVVRALLEIPGFPFYPDDQGKRYWFDHLDDLERYQDPPLRELTIEITHTEIIEGQEYFVFSDVPYDWPPVPNFFLAGQKVRFSEEGALLFRWNGQDIPFYVFQEDAYYITPKYPVLCNENLPVKHTIWPRFRPAGEPLLEGLKHPSSLSMASSVVFNVSWLEGLPKADWLNKHEEAVELGRVGFEAGYGIVYYERVIWASNFGPSGVPVSYFGNSILPVSAVIGGRKLEVSYEPFRFKWTNVQPTSWGQLKARHGQRP